MPRQRSSIEHLLRTLGIENLPNISSPEDLVSAWDASNISSRAVENWIGFPENDEIFLVVHNMTFSAPKHTHDYYELCFVLSGTVVNAIEGRHLYMLENSLCAMNLKSSHALEAIDEDAVVVNICLSRRLFEAGVFHDFIAGNSPIARFLRGDEDVAYLIFSDMDTRSLRAMVSAMVGEYSSAGKRQTFRLCGQALLLLDELARSNSVSFYGIDQKTMSMLKFLREHCDSVTVRNLAKTFGYSDNYCSQYLRMHTGKTATELIADARMNRAEDLLSTTSMDIETIARTVGYKSPSHFYELFRKRHNMTPTDYRMLGAELAGLLVSTEA